ncbi:wax ester/triacylglycerol synthase domain-containing protein [Mycobacterium uberis]|uniref:wax ester/triacylglycerol synthase domain-containing protein n=1 Tax=Mycobacterium uberis TaxID=2162698 RepID=UPI001FB3558C|nr:wax ester/triacylglycerol synthase domain-containing protein [Mycobacterium uberis]
MAHPFHNAPNVVHVRISGRRNIAYTELDLEDIKTVKNRFGVKVNNMVIALVSRVFRRYFWASTTCCPIRHRWQWCQFPCMVNLIGLYAIRFQICFPACRPRLKTERCSTSEFLCQMNYVSYQCHLVVELAAVCCTSGI